MNIAGLQYSLKHRCEEIYLSGCYGTCEGCHNSELKDFNEGKDWKEFRKEISYKKSSGMVKRIWILGGDPLDQDPDELEELLKFLREQYEEIWLWTRQESVPERFLPYLTYIKTGPYVASIPGYIDQETGVTIATGNQKIHKIH